MTTNKNDYQKGFMQNLKSRIQVAQINNLYSEMMRYPRWDNAIRCSNCGSDDYRFHNIDPSLPYHPIRLICMGCGGSVTKPKRIYKEVINFYSEKIKKSLEEDSKIHKFFGCRVDIKALFTRSLERLRVMLPNMEKLHTLSLLGYEDLHLRSFKDLIEDLALYNIDLNSLVYSYIEEILPDRVSLLKSRITKKHSKSLDVEYTSVLRPPYSVRSFAESCGFVSSSRESCYEPKNNEMNISYEDLDKDKIIELIIKKHESFYQDYIKDLTFLITALFDYRDSLVLMFFCEQDKAKKRSYKKLIKSYFRLYPRLLEVYDELRNKTN